MPACDLSISALGVYLGKQNALACPYLSKGLLVGRGIALGPTHGWHCDLRHGPTRMFLAPVRKCYTTASLLFHKANGQRVTPCFAVVGLDAANNGKHDIQNYQCQQHG